MSRELPILDFSDLEPVEIPFEYQGKKYLLKEASGAAAKKFQNERLGRITYGSNGKIEGFKNIADLAPMLVTMCVTTENGNAVSQSVVEAWPDKLVQRLFTTAKQISFLDEGTKVTKNLTDLLKEPGCPLNTEEFKTWALSLPEEQYGEIQTELKALTPKES
jgi:hypothetical protein